MSHFEQTWEFDFSEVSEAELPEYYTAVGDNIHDIVMEWALDIKATYNLNEHHKLTVTWGEEGFYVWFTGTIEPTDVQP